MLNGPNWHIYPKRFARFYVYLQGNNSKTNHSCKYKKITGANCTSSFDVLSVIY